MQTDDDALATFPAASAPTRWPAIAALSFGVFALVSAEFLPAGTLTPMAAGLGATVGGAGQAVTATAVFGGFAALATPLFAQRVERRVILFSMLGLLLVSDALAASATNLPTMYLARALLGLCIGGFWSLAGAVVLPLAAPGAFPRALSLLFAGVSLATVLAAPAAAFIAGLWGWRVAYWLAMALAAFAGLLQFATLPRLGAGSAASWREFVEVSGRPAIFIALLSLIVLVAGHFGGFTYIRPLLERVTRLDAPAVSAALLAFGLAGFIGNLAGAALAERSPRNAALTGAAAIALATAALALGGDNAAVVWGALIVWGAGFAIVPISYQTWATTEAADRPEVVGGLLTAAFQVSIAVGAMGGGLVVDRFGPASVDGAAALAAVAAAIAIVLWARAPAPRSEIASGEAGAE
jgi:DHA1 family purine ribonucleoside efflux pump-like MFS transporter